MMGWEEGKREKERKGAERGTEGTVSVNGNGERGWS